MDEIRQRFENEVTALLSGAPESAAKADIIDELAENLTGRYEDMTGAGMDEKDAFAKALASLRDVDEIIAYLSDPDPYGRGTPGPEPETAARDSLEDRPDPAQDTELSPAGPDGDAAYAAAGEAVIPVDAYQDAPEEEAVMSWDQAYFADEAIPAAFAGGRIHAEPQFDRRMGAWLVPEQAVAGLDVKLQHADVNVMLNSYDDGSIYIRGDTGGLSVTLSDAGILKVREGFSLRGITGRDVVFFIPGRQLTDVRIAIAFGDIDINGISAETITLSAGSGDIDCRVKECVRGAFKTASGDIGCAGIWQSFQAETVGGDVELKGAAADARVTTAAGDVDLAGAVSRAHVRSVSGDIEVVSQSLPQALDLSSKSGDIDVAVPGGSPFQAKLNTVSGDVDFDFPKRWASRLMPGGSGPKYVLSSISGDICMTRLS